MPPRAPTPRARLDPALVVVLAGVCAALHIGKLPPAIAPLRDALGLTLVQAGFLLSLVQVSGMLLGLAFGAVADTLGARRSLLIGLAVLGAASAAGGFSQGVPALMLLRALEGFGFLLVVLPAPGLVRALVPAQRVPAMMGLWGAYMPLATALALLSGPHVIDALGWRGWWWLLAGVSWAMAGLVARAVPTGAGATGATQRWTSRLRQTLAAPGPWLAATAFAMYSGQWLAVIGFLPTIGAQAGFSAGAAGGMAALAAAANMAGNIGGGRLLQRGVPAGVVLATGFGTMALAAVVAFAEVHGQGLPGTVRYAAVLLFSGVGGFVPATLFAMAVRVAPGEGLLSTTVGWLQQWSALGQFFGPPLVAWVASRSGGWQWTWLATGGCSLIGLAISAALVRHARHLPSDRPRAAVDAAPPSTRRP